MAFPDFFGVITATLLLVCCTVSILLSEQEIVQSDR